MRHRLILKIAATTGCAAIVLAFAAPGRRLLPRSSRPASAPDLPWIPAPGPDRRLASESVRAFSSDLLALLRRPPVLIALAQFLAPCGCFALTILLGGIGADFHASPRLVSWAGGLGSLIAGVFGSLMLPPLAKRMPFRSLYLAIGFTGASFTLSTLLLPRAAATFLIHLHRRAVLPVPRHRLLPRRIV